MTNQYRIRGRFASTRVLKAIGWIIIIGCLIMLLGHGYVMATLERMEITAENPVPAIGTIIAHADMTDGAKIDAYKEELVDDLARKCESKSAKEPDALIIFDTNNEASLGAWQFQIKTVQHYVKLFEGRDISRRDAILIALDHEQARALAHRIIFEEQGGIYNWKNCAEKLDLVTKVEVIKAIQSQ